MGLSYGKATIAADLPPFREKKEQGAVETFTSIRSLRMKIKRLLKNKDERLKLEEGAREYALRNRWSPNIALEHIKLYESLV